MHATTNASATRNGTTAANILIREASIPATRFTTKTFKPIGGVIIPISSSFTTRTPNQTMSIPSALIIGRKTGRVIKSAPNGSINMPSTKYMATISKICVNCVNSRPAVANTKYDDSPVIPRKRVNIVAPTATMNIAVVVRTVSDNTNQAISFVRRPRNPATTKVIIDPTAPASVGVKIPVKSPPKTHPARAIAGHALRKATPSLMVLSPGSARRGTMSGRMKAVVKMTTT